MDPLDDFLERERRQTPPPGHERAVEARVMASLAHEQPRHIRQWAALGLAVAVTTVLVVRFGRSPEPARPQAASPDFVESVVLLDGHTCIWLEPAASREGAHE